MSSQPDDVLGSNPDPLGLDNLVRDIMKVPYSKSKAIAAIKALIAEQVREARVEEQAKCQELVNYMANSKADRYKYSKELAELQKPTSSEEKHDI